MEKMLTMSKKELKRIKILEQIGEKTITVVEGSEAIGISIRQTYRILKRYREEGDEGVIHRLRGKPSNRGYPNELKEQVIGHIVMLQMEKELLKFV